MTVLLFAISVNNVYTDNTSNIGSKEAVWLYVELLLLLYIY